MAPPQLSRRGAGRAAALRLWTPPPPHGAPGASAALRGSCGSGHGQTPPQSLVKRPRLRERNGGVGLFMATPNREEKRAGGGAGSSGGRHGASVPVRGGPAGPPAVACTSGAARNAASLPFFFLSFKASFPELLRKRTRRSSPRTAARGAARAALPSRGAEPRTGTKTEITPCLLFLSVCLF